MTEFALLIAATFLAGTLSAVTGFGGAAILLPLLVTAFGPREAIPILTIAQLIGNGSRCWFNREALDLQVVSRFAVGAVPAAVVGGLLFANAPLPALTRLLGGFLIAIVVYRHVRKRPPVMPLAAFTHLGAVSSFLSALLGTVGPLMAPFFLGYGLTKAAYIGTESLCSLIMHVVKLGTYGSATLLSAKGMEIGIIMGLGLLIGAYIGKHIVDRVSERAFVLLVEATLLIAGVRFLVVG